MPHVTCVRRTSVLAATVCALALLGPAYAAPRNPALDALPGLVLWAWERPEDLRFLDRDTAVAFLAQTIIVAPHGLDVIPRRQPLRVSPGTPLVAVTRVETTMAVPLTRQVAGEISGAIARTASLPGVAAVQVDFDAVQSERALYRELLGRLRRALDARTPLSMTALASWCMDDNWIDDLPVDEVVPMLFRMGASEQHRQPAAAAGALKGRACGDAVGTSLDEPILLRADHRRHYVFSPRRWTDGLVAEARRRARQ